MCRRTQALVVIYAVMRRNRPCSCCQNESHNGRSGRGLSNSFLFILTICNELVLVNRYTIIYVPLHLSGDYHNIIYIGHETTRWKTRNFNSMRSILNGTIPRSTAGYYTVQKTFKDRYIEVVLSLIMLPCAMLVIRESVAHSDS